MTPLPAVAPSVAPTRLLFESALLRAGEFAIAPEAPGFADAGQMRRAEFVFPRRGVWIEHADAPPFAADPTLVTLYNAGEPYRRHRLDPQGDRCDWFAPAPETVLDVVASVDPAIRERPERPFRFHSAPVDARCVAAQRRLARRLRAPGGCDPLEVEETMLAILRRIVVADYASDGARRAAAAAPRARRRGQGVRAAARRRTAEPRAHRWRAVGVPSPGGGRQGAAAQRGSTGERRAASRANSAGLRPSRSASSAA